MRHLRASMIAALLATTAPAAAQPVPPGEFGPAYATGLAPGPNMPGSPAPMLPPQEILASVRSAGFNPLSRPIPRGPVYVVFAADRYMIDVRVTVDARSGRVLAATRLAGAAFGGPVYDGRDMLPRAMALPRGYEAPPVPPADIPGVSDGARRAPPTPLPRARPGERAGDIITGSVKAAPSAPPSPGAESAEAAPPTALGDTTAQPAAPPQSPAPKLPAMVPVAPLE